MLSLKNIIREILLSLLAFFGNLFFLFSAKPKIEPEKVKKVLFIKLYALGDIVHAQPIIPNIRANFPQAEIIWLVERYSRSVVDHIQDVDKIIEWQGLATIKLLQKEKIDLAFSPYRSPFVGLIFWLARIPIRVGLNWQGRGFALTNKIQFRGDILESDRYLKLLEDIGLKIVTHEKSLKVSEQEKKAVKKKLTELGLNFSKRPLVGIAPGGGDNPQLLMPMKRWDPTRYSRVADYLIEKYQAQVVLVGAPSESELAEKCQKSAKNKIINLVGKTKLIDLVAILSLFDLYIACDTGTLHIASALGVKIIGLFGPTNPDLIIKPNPNRLVIRKEAEKPIYTPEKVFTRKFSGQNNDPIHPSMLKIEVEDVVEAINKILSTKFKKNNHVILNRSNY